MVLLNGAGGSAADPILKGLSISEVLAASTFDVASVVGAWIDNNSTIPGTNSILSSLSPASIVLTAGLTGTYNDATKQYNIGSTTGLSVGNFIYFSHASMPDNVYEILTIANSTNVTLKVNPLNGLGNKSGISFQVAWTYTGNTATAPIVSSVAGQINYAKVRFRDGAGSDGDLASPFYVADAPAGAAFISIGGQSYTGSALGSSTPTLAILSAWANKGGISHVQIGNHSVQGSNNFQWGDVGAGTAEKSIADAITAGLKLSAGDGLKYAQLQLKTKAGGTIFGVDISVTLDTTGPTPLIFLMGA